MKKNRQQLSSRGIALRLVRGILGPMGHVRRLHEDRVESGWFNAEGAFKHKHYAKTWNELIAKLQKGRAAK